MRLIFVDPFASPFSRAELLVKGTPLVLIALGLAFGFRANVWNIGQRGNLPSAHSAVALWRWRSTRWKGSG